MNTIDVILIAALALILFFAIRRAVRSRGSCSCGCSSCGGNCAACGADCPSRKKDEIK